ncbi:glycosyltransferase family 2 protein [Candidatus Saccharibacteria bacterium]|nr:glycosyltransferase family 2 protein [Candidatus Saccharibacteria bacterium]
MAAKSQKILSIAVASYNRGDMINECLDSFCDARFIDDIEVLVIDDGSTDDTPKRVNEYVKKYPKSIKQIFQPNSGPGAAVNNGIEHATGKYFRIVDGDDWVNTEDFARLIEKLKTVDVDAVFTNYVPFHDGRKEPKEPKVITDMPVGEVFDFNTYHYTYNPPVQMHNTIFRTDIMKKHVRLDNGFYTDSEYMFYPTPYIKKAIYYDLNIYMYRVAMAGQSTSPEKMRRNLANHRLILDRHLAYYEKVAARLDINVRKYLARQVSGFVINHFDIVLLAKEEDMTRQIKDLFKLVQREHPDIFDFLKKDIKYRITLGGNSILLRIFSIYLNERYKHL